MEPQVCTVGTRTQCLCGPVSEGRWPPGEGRSVTRQSAGGRSGERVYGQVARVYQGRICPQRGKHIGRAAPRLSSVATLRPAAEAARLHVSQRNEGDLFHRLWHIMNEILDLRRQVLVGHLTHDRMRDVKRHITARLDWGNE